MLRSTLIQRFAAAFILVCSITCKSLGEPPASLLRKSVLDDQPTQSIPFGKRAFRSSASVSEINWSRNGKRIIAFGSSTIQSFHADSGALLSSFQWLGSYGFVVLPDEKHMAIRTRGSFTVVDIESGKKVYSIIPDDQFAFSCCCLLDGGYVAGSLRQHSDVIGIWDLKTREKVKEFQGFKQLKLLASSRDGLRIALGTFEKTLQVIDAKTGEQIWASGAFDKNIDQIIFSPNGKFVAVLFLSGAVQIRDAMKGYILQTFKHPGPGVGSFASFIFSQDNQTIVTGDNEGPIRIWDCATGKQIRAFDGVFGSNEAMALSPKGDLLATGGHYESVFIFEMKTGKRIAPQDDGHIAAVSSVGFAIDGKQIFTASKDRTIRFWDKQSAKALKHLEGAQWQERRVVARLHPDGNSIVAGGSFDPRIRTWDIYSGKQVEAIPVAGQGAHELVLSLDGKTLVYIVSNNLHIWDISQQKNRVDPIRLPFPVFATDGLLFLPDSRTLLLVGRTEIAFLDSQTGAIDRQEKLISGGLASGFDAASLSVDGRYLALSHFSNIEIREMATMQPVRKFNGVHTAYARFIPNEIGALALLSDGRLFSAGHNGNFCLWDPRIEDVRLPKSPSGYVPIAPKEPPLLLKGHTGAITCFAISPDGTELLTGSSDTTAMLWKIPPLPKSDTKLTDEQLKQIWLDLKDDAAKAHKSLWKATEDPKPTLAMLERNVPIAQVPEAATVRALIAELSSNRFAVRQAAYDKLNALDTLVVPALKEHLKSKPEENVREQIDKLLKAADPWTWTGDRLRELRAVQCVEMIGTPEAKTLLDKWSKGPAEARLTKEAKLAADRLGKLLELRNASK